LKEKVAKRLAYFVGLLSRGLYGRPDSQDNDIQLNDTQHKGLFVTLSVKPLCFNAECHYTECRVLFTVMLNVIMLSVILLNVVRLSVILLNVIRLSVVMIIVAALPGPRHSA
jgi:hypothetical protein